MSKRSFLEQVVPGFTIAQLNENALCFYRTGR